MHRVEHDSEGDRPENRLHETPDEPDERRRDDDQEGGEENALGGVSVHDQAYSG